MLHLGWDENGDGIIDIWAVGTGFMIGEKTLVTAGHCFWNSSKGGWVIECRIHPFQNADTINTAYYYPSTWVCSTAYTSSEDNNYDWCVANLFSSIGTQTGYFGFGTGGNMDAGSYTLSGYSGDYLYHQYYSSGSIQSANTYTCNFKINAVGGQSGAPLFDGTIAWAIVVGGKSTILGKYNYGCRITRELFDIMNEWRTSS